MQFPVSSGQHHRKGEEWRPVSPTPPPQKNQEKTAPAVAQPIAVPTSSIPLPPEPVVAPPVSTLIQPQATPIEVEYQAAVAVQAAENTTLSMIVSKKAINIQIHIVLNTT